MQDFNLPVSIDFRKPGLPLVHVSSAASCCMPGSQTCEHADIIRPSRQTSDVRYYLGPSFLSEAPECCNALRGSQDGSSNCDCYSDPPDKVGLSDSRSGDRRQYLDYELEWDHPQYSAD